MKFIFLLIILFSAISVADSYYVDATRGNGIGSEDGNAISDLVRSSVAESGRNVLVSDPKSAQFILNPRVIKLGSSYVMTVEKSKDGKIVFSSQLKATKVEELDGVAARLTRAALDETPVRGDARIGDVTEIEASAGARRKETQKHWFFGFGPFGASNMGTSGTLYNLDIAYAWDINTYQLKIFYDGTVPGSNSPTSVTTSSGQTVNVTSLGDIGLGLNYYIRDTDMAPFVSGDFGYGGNSSVSSFIGGIGAGIGLFRTSNINMEVALRYAYMFNSTPIGNPSVYGARLGLYF